MLALWARWQRPCVVHHVHSEDAPAEDHVGPTIASPFSTASAPYVRRGSRMPVASAGRPTVFFTRTKRCVRQMLDFRPRHRNSIGVVGDMKVTSRFAPQPRRIPMRTKLADLPRSSRRASCRRHWPIHPTTTRRPRPSSTRSVTLSMRTSRPRPSSTRLFFAQIRSAQSVSLPVLSTTATTRTEPAAAALATIGICVTTRASNKSRLTQSGPRGGAAPLSLLLR